MCTFDISIIFKFNFFNIFWFMLILTTIGNDDIHQLTKNSPQKLRVHLQQFSGKKGHAEYSRFAVGDENSKYKLSISGYSGNIG